MSKTGGRIDDDTLIIDEANASWTLVVQVRKERSTWGLAPSPISLTKSKGWVFTIIDWCDESGNMKLCPELASWNACVQKVYFGTTWNDGAGLLEIAKEDNDFATK